MQTEYRTADWDSYRMVYGEPHRELEPPEREIAVVDEALDALVGAGVLPHAEYDHEKSSPTAVPSPSGSTSPGRRSRRGCSG